MNFTKKEVEIILDLLNSKIDEYADIAYSLVKQDLFDLAKEYRQEIDVLKNIISKLEQQA